jgi:phosphoribosyl 1,2-cyclic phosphodiesterase
LYDDGNLYLWEELNTGMTETLFTDTFEFCSLGSGSSGNSYYIGNGFEGFLIDAGLNGQHLKRNLQSIGIEIEKIKGIIITHDHIDHIRALNAMTRIYNMPVYATFGTWRGILNNRFAGNVEHSCHELIDTKQEFMIAGFTIQAFPVSHDAQEPVGFHITKGDKSLTLATDIGIIGESAAHFLKKANAVILESNYDVEMLINGRYTKELKNRILGDKGHLDNMEAAKFIAENYSEKMSHIFLCHLSQENNTPELALQALHQAIIEKEVKLHPDTIIHALPRTHRSDLHNI